MFKYEHNYIHLVLSAFSYCSWVGKGKTIMACCKLANSCAEVSEDLSCQNLAQRGRYANVSRHGGKHGFAKVSVDWGCHLGVAFICLSVL